MFSWIALAGAFGGGMFGAAIGALPAFAFTGFSVLVGVALALAGADYDFLGQVAFGPVFGPHISFAGGVAAAAYAARRGELEDGADIISPLAGLATVDVLLVGGVFGAGGYLAQVALTPAIGDYIDVVALLVFLSDIVARLAFGRSGLFGTTPEDGGSRFVPHGEHVWVEYQQDWLQAAGLGLASGLFSSFLALSILEVNPDATLAAITAGFGISAATLFFLALGAEFPVTHHMSISAAYVAVASGNLLLGALAGIVAALVGEAVSRAFYVRGDTHVDPPAGAIAIMSLFGLVPMALAG
jgi:hypothetical protein